METFFGYPVSCKAEGIMIQLRKPKKEKWFPEIPIYQSNKADRKAS